MPKSPKNTSYQEILKTEIEKGLTELKRPKSGLFLSSLSGGLDVGFSLLLMATMLTLTSGVFPGAVTHILVSAMYSIGFIFVILGRSELFTEHTNLAVLPVLNGQATILNLLRLWGVIWVGNVIGAATFASIISFTGPALGVIDKSSLSEIANNLILHKWWIILVSAILAGWMMGLLSWLVSAGRDAIGNIVIIFLITSSIGLAGLHHSIVGTAEVFAGLLVDPNITFTNFANFLIWTTLGNAIGGTFFVALIKFAHSSIPGTIPKKIKM